MITHFRSSLLVFACFRLASTTFIIITIIIITTTIITIIIIIMNQVIRQTYELLAIGDKNPSRLMRIWGNVANKYELMMC
jgi:hypothetical protein